MKMILLMLIISCLSSCNNYPRIADQEQLSPIFIYDSEGNIDMQESYCLSRIYRINRGYIGPINNSIKLDIKECDRVIGYAPDEYGVFATWLDRFRRWLLQF